MTFPRLVPALGPALLLLALIAAAPDGRAREVEANAAVATEHPLATRAALDVLAQGGDAADAAVAAALVAGVVSPTSSGLGGGGFALILVPGETVPHVIDFRETAPSALDPKALEQKPLPFEQRGLMIGVPGEARGLFEIVNRFGKRPFRELTRAAERHARTGYAVSPHMNRILSSRMAPDLKRDPGLARLFFPGGNAALVGKKIKNAALARTLTRLGAEGPNAIYDGAIGAEIVAGARAAASPITADDLRGYAARERTPLKVSWAGYDIFTMPPPSAGGLLVAQTLGMIPVETVRRMTPHGPAYQHLLAEAFRAAFIDRFRHAGDPDLVSVDTQALLAPQRLSRMRSRLALDRTHALPLLAQEEHGTHHLLVADRTGMVVSLTTTVNRPFGAKIALPDSGIVLNDELNDFTLAEDAATLGVKASPNAPRPNARPVSSMTPTIVLQAGRPVLALGGSGGMTISPNVTQLLVARLAFGQTPAELTRAARFHIPFRPPNTLLVDPSTPAEHREELAYRGERVGNIDFDISAVQVLARTANGWQGAADPRKFGSAETLPATKP